MVDNGQLRVFNAWFSVYECLRPPRTNNMGDHESYQYMDSSDDGHISEEFLHVPCTSQGPNRWGAVGCHVEPMLKGPNVDAILEPSWASRLGSAAGVAPLSLGISA